MKLLVLAKEPVAGAVKTRLCPPLEPAQAAAVAEAALHDTLIAVCASGADHRVLVLDGQPGPWLPEGFRVVPQQGVTLADRLTAAWRHSEGPAVQIGMDTPQVDAGMLDGAMSTLIRSSSGAVLGLAEDGGWWAIGQLEADERIFAGIPTSTPTTGADQRSALIRLGRDPVLLQTLRDVDTWHDAVRVARDCPTGLFAAAVRRLAIVHQARNGAKP